MVKEKEIPRTIRLPESLRQKAIERAAEEKRSLQQHIIYLLEKDARKSRKRQLLPA